MARPGRSSSDADKPEETEAPPPKADDKSSASGSVLLFNAHGGMYCANIVTKKEHQPGTAAAEDPKSRFDIERIVFPPGLYLATAEQYEKIRKLGGFAGRVMDHAMVVLTGNPKVSPTEVGPVSSDWVKDWQSMRSRQKLDYIDHSAHAPTLEALLAIEESQDVSDAIEEQVEDLTEAAQGRDKARRAQRAHNRSKVRRRGRGGRLLN